MAERSDSKILKSLKGFIFDMDGTILDSMGLWDRLYAELFAADGLTLPTDFALAVNHLKLSDCAEYAARNTPVKMSREQIEEFWHERALEEYSDKVPLKHYAAKLLSLLVKHGGRIGVATALGEDLFWPCLKQHGVAPLFWSGTSIDEVGVGKDKPDVYLRECSKLGLKPSECAVFEDSHIGIESAKKAGFFTVGIYDAASAEHWDTLKYYADIACRSLRQAYYAFKNAYNCRSPHE